MVLFNYIIPISLYVTIEFQKFVGSMFFGWDTDLYDAENDLAAKCNSSDLNEELGQVEYLFTDKTGTLTENDMQFRQCSIMGEKYVEEGGSLCHLSSENTAVPVTTYTDDMQAFLEVLVLCHSVHVANATTHHIIQDCLATPGDVDTGILEYQASSPDEKAFLDACRRYDVIFLGTSDGYLVMRFRGEVLKYKLLHTLEFDATRKRMSVIVEKADGIYLLCKGAESSVLKRCSGGDRDGVLSHVNDYAMMGLRTLVLAHRKLAPKELAKIEAILVDARTSLEHNEEMVAKAYDKVEQDLTVLGATGVEDRLQDHVPETIESLRAAGIKVWVLTGDKEETAVNISHSCGHFKRAMKVLRVCRQRDSSECSATITDALQIISREKLDNYGLVVDGASLNYLLQEHKDVFARLCSYCTAVLCCRMSPIQKAQIVQLIKHSKHKPITAAIGDGANDVSMIQEAHVGLGIMGKEGRQAVRCSDFAFSKFHCLLKVFLVHGHFYYHRLSILVQYFFYKNVGFITAQVLFAFYSGFSEQSIYDTLYLTFYNIFYTSLPIFLFGLSEQIVQPQKLLQNPELYKIIRNNSLLKWPEFFKWFLLGLWHAFVLYFGVLLMFQSGNGTLGAKQQAYGLWSLGTLIYTGVVIVINLKLCLETRFWSGLAVFSYVMTFLGFVSTVFLYTGVLIRYTDPLRMFWVYPQLLALPSTWLLLVLLIVTCLIPDLLVKLYTNTLGVDSLYLRAHIEYGDRIGGEPEAGATPPENIENIQVVLPAARFCQVTGTNAVERGYSNASDQSRRGLIGAMEGGGDGGGDTYHQHHNHHNHTAAGFVKSRGGEVIEMSSKKGFPALPNDISHHAQFKFSALKEQDESLGVQQQQSIPTPVIAIHS